jgi:hypothetical protein
MKILLITDNTDYINSIIEKYKTFLIMFNHEVDILTYFNNDKKYDIIHSFTKNFMSNEFLFTFSEYDKKNYKKMSRIIDNSIISLTFNNDYLNDFRNDKLFYLKLTDDWLLNTKRLERIYLNIIDIKTDFTDEVSRNRYVSIYSE